MAWKGGYNGTGWNRDEFRAWLRTQTKPAWANGLVVHNTGAPYIRPPVAPAQRMMNLGTYYKKMGWSGGPHFVVIYDRVYLGTPVSLQGTHSPSWNKTKIGFEVEGDYRAGKHDPATGDGKVAWDTAGWALAELAAWHAPLGARVLHREDPKTTHACPGDLISRAFVDAKVANATRAPEKPVQPVSPPPATSPPPNPLPAASGQMWGRVNTPGDTLTLRTGAGTKFAAKGVLPHNLRVQLLTKWAKDVWVEVLSPAGYRGFVNGKYIVPEAVLPTTPAPPAPTPMKNPDRAMALLIEKGLSRVQAAGVVANLQRESYPDLRAGAQGDYVLNGKAVPRGTSGAVPTAFGIGQWRNERKTNLDAFAASRGKGWTDFDSQVLYVLHELGTSEKLAGAWLFRATTIEEAVAAMTFYERPKGYVSANARAAQNFVGVLDVARKVDGWAERLAFGRALV